MSIKKVKSTPGQQIETLKTARWWPKFRVVLAWLNRLLRRNTLLHARISGWLLKRFPALHYKIRYLLRSGSLPKRKIKADSSKSGRVTGGTTLARRRNAVLSDPGLVSLVRPKLNLDEYLVADGDGRVEKLYPVHDLNQMRQGPTSVCFVLTVDKESGGDLEETLNSIFLQTDPSWEVIICAPKKYENLTAVWMDIDWRIRRLEVPEQALPANSLTMAATHATAEYIGSVAQGDLVNPDLVKSIGDCYRDLQAPDVIYTDQAKSDEKEEMLWFKPDWSPEHMLSVNLLSRFVAVQKRSVLNMRVPSDFKTMAGSEYWFALQLTRLAKKIVHIDEVMYVSKRNDTAALGGFFSEGSRAEAKAVLQHYIDASEGQGRAVVEDGLKDGSLYVDWLVPSNTEVTLVILTGMFEKEIHGRGQVVLAENFVRSVIEKTEFDNYKIIVVHDGSISESFQSFLEAHGHASSCYKKTTPFSFANKANYGVSLVESGVVILLNDDLEVISPKWISALVSQAVRPEIGVVGARLLFENGTLQHAGLALGIHDSVGHIFHRAPSDLCEYAGYASVVRNYSAVTGAVMAFRREVFDEMGGFDEFFRTDYNDVDFCLRCVKSGYRIVYNPAATLYHFHNSSYKRMADKDEERIEFLSRWEGGVERDPYFSKHFQRASSDLPLLFE